MLGKREKKSQRDFFVILLKSQWLSLALLAAYVILVLILAEFTKFSFQIIPFILLSTTGTALVMLLSFRFRMSYDRWWEARGQWEAIISCSRTFIRQSFAYPHCTDPSLETKIELQKFKKGLVKLQIAFVSSLNLHLTDYQQNEDEAHLIPAKLDKLKKFLNNDDVNMLEDTPNLPVGILHLISGKIQSGRQKEYINDTQYLLLEYSVKDATQILGRFEKIRWTPVPFYYNYFITILIHIFCFCLPLSFTEIAGWGTLPFVFFYFILFYSLHALHLRTETPFGQRVFDISGIRYSDLINRLFVYHDNKD